MVMCLGDPPGAVSDATLCYPVVDGEVLLIEKQRGLGAGKLVGPGGKVEGTETPRECVVREVMEELHVRPREPSKVGEFTFRLGDEAPRLVHVFRATGVDGTPRPSPEAIPHWFPADDLPYDRMWADDRHWLPHLLDHRPFTAQFTLDADGDTLLESRVDTGDVDWQ